MSWARLAELIRRHPGRALGISLLVLMPFTFGNLATHVSYNVLEELPSSAESVRGYQALKGHFQEGELSPVLVVLKAKQSLWNDASFRAINDLTRAIGKVSNVGTVRSVTQPTGGAVSAKDLEASGLGDLASFPEQLKQGADGTAQVISGLQTIRSGLKTIRAQLPELASGLADASAGLRSMRTGIAQMRAGMKQMKAGLVVAADSLDKSGADNDLADLAASAATDSYAAFDKLYNQSFPTSKLDPAVQAAIVSAGQAYAELTGHDPLNPSSPAQDPSNPSRNADIKRLFDAGGLSGSLRTVATGLRDVVKGLASEDDGLAQVDAALARIVPGLSQGSTGVGDALSGIDQMITGLDKILPGLRQLKQGLDQGTQLVRSVGLSEVSSVGSFGLLPGLIDSVPGLRKRLAPFISDDGKTIRLFVTLSKEPYHTDSLTAVDEIRHEGAVALNKTPLAGTPVMVAGTSAAFEDIRIMLRSDTRIIVGAVITGVLLVLVLLLRSLVAPLYLVLTVLLSMFSTLGLTTLVFDGLLHRGGMPWWLPMIVFVMLVALGADYNIFLMSRIREDAVEKSTEEAVANGLASTGHVITSAGLILAGTFAVLVIAPLKSLQQLGFAVAVGILLDTFVVRSLLVPSLATLLGRLNWWPSSRHRSP